MTNSEKKIEDLSFEEALNELETVVNSLESGKIDLQRSIETYEHGMKLKKLCEEKLSEAQSKIEKITIDAEGNVSASEVN